MPSLLHPPVVPLRAGERQRWGSLQGSAASLAAVALARQLDAPLLWIATDSAAARRVEQELRFFDADLPIAQFPDWETLPYDSFSPHQDIVSERLTTLYRLPEFRRGILVVPVSTLMHRLPPASYLLGNSLMVRVGQQLDVNSFRERLTRSGYSTVNTVYEPGEFALRGALLDIFPTGSKVPYRIDLLDDEVDTLRTFDPETQRTIERVNEVRMLPGREYPLTPEAIRQFRDRWHASFDVQHKRCPIYQDISAGLPAAGAEYFLPLFFEHTATLFDYLPSQVLVIAEPGLDKAAEQFWTEASRRYEDLHDHPERPLLPPSRVFLPVDQLFGQLRRLARLEAGSAPAGHDFATEPPPALHIDARAEDPVAALRQFQQQRSERILIAADSRGRQESLIELLTRHQLPVTPVASWADFLASDAALAITVAPLEQGLVASGIALITESQLFARHVMQSRRRRRSDDQGAAVIRDLTELRIGAPVVHIDHGVGRYQGLQNLAVDNQQEEFLTLEYADEARLYVPVTSLHLISRYAGSDPEMAPLHRLGSEQWDRAKRRAAEKIRDVAAELLDIYARRAARKGHAFPHPGQAYEAFAASFPFEETPDQQAAIEAVLTDMTTDTAMDRLVCGDVGFGKTEVAMRAAFVAVHSGSQVAVLVPTTLLAQQHYQSFQDRFADWPVRIAVLSRFSTGREQEKTLQDLAEGKVDILIGTHKLLQKSVQYQDLGLVIIDEEHRFGVRQKDQLKALRAEVDVLTLTATPIPRTLNMAMSGMRDLSIIATPPARRLSVKTFVRRQDTALVKEAILREIRRGGQVYYLHNEVKTIERKARELERLLPELRVGVGHGQMRERELEQVMSDFYHKRHNVLVCSTIIETGIDVPNANTIIIERADKFGLAQLHQLRGRVGRSHHQAYAYLLTPEPRHMTADAIKRLEAISQAEDLGAGFTLASHDLEIRGAGELLGDEQSGQIQSIGFTLYMEMLDRAVQALRSGHAGDIEQALEPADATEVNLRIPTLIPDDYLPDVHMRLIFYKRIASARDEMDLRELQVEMIDRFGLLPDPLRNLFRATHLKLIAERLGIHKLEAGPQGGKLEFDERTRVEPIALVKLVQTQPQQYRLIGATTLGFTASLDSAEQRCEFVEQLLATLTPPDAEQSAA